MIVGGRRHPDLAGEAKFGSISSWLGGGDEKREKKKFIGRGPSSDLVAASKFGGAVGSMAFRPLCFSPVSHSSRSLLVVLCTLAFRALKCLDAELEV